MRLESRNIKGTRDASHDMIFAGIITKGLFEKKDINFLVWLSPECRNHKNTSSSLDGTMMG